jgi:hypothetical protein
MPFSLYKSPDLYISFQVKNDLWIGCNIVLSKTSNYTNGYHKTLISWVSAPVTCLGANSYYCDTGKQYSKAIVQCIKQFLPH